MIRASTWKETGKCHRWRRRWFGGGGGSLIIQPECRVQRKGGRIDERGTDEEANMKKKGAGGACESLASMRERERAQDERGISVDSHHHYSSAERRPGGFGIKPITSDTGFLCAQK